MIRAAALLACLLLAACGQKGNLFLPDQSRPVVVPATPMASPAPAANAAPAASPAPVADPAPPPANDAAAGQADDKKRQRQQPAAPGTSPGN